MKKIYFLITLLAIVVLSSCSSDDDKLRAMIPNDAVGVVKINIPSLMEKSGMKSGESISLPADLKKVIDEADANIVSDVVLNLPNSGIDMENSCYIFFSPGTFRAVALFHLKDADKAKSMVEKIASGKMKKMSGVQFVAHTDYGYAIDDDVLMIARYRTPVSEDVASGAASKIFDMSRPSLLEDDDIAECIDKENCDVAAYFDVKSMSSIYSKYLKINAMLTDLQPMDLITGLGIKAVTATVNFNNSNKEVKIETDFIYDKNSMYSTFYDQVIACAQGGDGVASLEALPGEFDTYFAIKINGENLVKQPLISMGIQWLESTPFVSGVRCSEIAASLNGTLAFGVAKGQVGDYNFGLSAQSIQPEMVVNEIVEAAKRGGQPPYKNQNGEYVYDYNFGSQAFALSQTGGVVYMRCVDFVSNYSVAKWSILTDAIKKSKVVFFKKVLIGETQEGTLCWGLRDKTHGAGVFSPENKNENVVISVLKTLCWKEPTNGFDDGMEDEYDYGF